MRNGSEGELFHQMNCFFRPESNHCIGYLSQWLTLSSSVDLIDVALACEDANSKPVHVVTDADVDAEKRADDSLEVEVWS